MADVLNRARERAGGKSLRLSLWMLASMTACGMSDAQLMAADEDVGSVAQPLAKALPPSAPLAMRHSMTAAEYQSEFESQRAKGLRPTRISAYSVAGQPRFSGIWEDIPGPAF